MAQFAQIITLRDWLPFSSVFLAIVVVEKTDCRDLLEVHRNVIDVESTAFLMILLAPKVSFVTLHMQWHKGCFPKASTIRPQCDPSLSYEKIRVSLFDVLFQTFSNLKLKQRKRNEKRKGLVTVFVKVFMVSASK